MNAAITAVHLPLRIPTSTLLSERLETATPVPRHCWAPSGCGWPWLGHRARWHRRCRPDHFEAWVASGTDKECTGEVEADGRGIYFRLGLALGRRNYVSRLASLSADPASNVNQ
jgi:hypothetical protein